jgi:hypothetical protein
MAELVEIGYERLFNLGNFEHEKFIIKKNVQAETEYQAWKQLSIHLADFEKDLGRFRDLVNKFFSIKAWVEHNQNVGINIDPKEIEKTKAEMKLIASEIYAFRSVHMPVSQPCKCAFCKSKTQEVTGGSQEYPVEVEA